MKKRILAIDSSAAVGAVALCEGETLIASATLHDSNKHSETLLPMVEGVLKSAGMTVGDIDIFAAAVGPGSFTGIRIGISMIKGLAFGSSKPCVGVSTLEALACNLKELDGLICPVMDARREQVYNALFRFEKGKCVRLCEDRLIPIADLTAELAELDEPVYLAGDGYDLIDAERLPLLRPTPAILRDASGYGVAMAALAAAEAGNTPGDLELLPVYLRATQAERERLERLSENQPKDMKS